MIQNSAPQALARQTRENAFDMMRGLAILGVVYIHGANLFTPAVPVWLDRGYFQWAVPVFFILSALFSIRSLRAKQVSAPSFLKRRYRKLLIPYLVFSLIYLVILANWKTISVSVLLTKHLSGYGWSGQYFFILLFQIMLLYPVLNKINLKINVVVYTLFAFLFLFPLFALLMSHSALMGKINDRLFIYWLPYPIIGAYLAQNENTFRDLPRRFSPFVAFLVCVLVPLLIIAEKRGLALFADQSYVLDSVLISSITLFFFLPSLLSRWHGKSGQVLGLIGRYSLGIFCLNPLVIIATTRLGESINLHFSIPPLLQIVLPFMAVAYVCCVCMAIIAVVERLGGRDLVQ